MVKKWYLFVFVSLGLCLILPNDSYSQYNRLKNANSLETQVGFSPVGLYATQFYVHQLGKKIHGKAGIGFVNGKVQDLQYYSPFIEVNIGYNFYEFSRSVYFHVFGGFAVHADIHQGMLVEDLDKDVYFNYGALVGAEVLISMTHKISMVIQGNQRILVNSEFGRFRVMVGAGIRYYIR